VHPARRTKVALDVWWKIKRNWLCPYSYSIDENRCTNYKSITGARWEIKRSTDKLHCSIWILFCRLDNLNNLLNTPVYNERENIIERARWDKFTLHIALDWWKAALAAAGMRQRPLTPRAQLCCVFESLPALLSDHGGALFFICVCLLLL
jgi:hypothetical protein